MVYGVHSSLVRRGRAGADADEDALLLRRHLAHRQRGGRVGAAQQHVDALLVHPLAGLGGGDVGLVLVIGRDQFDRLAEHLVARVLDRHLDRLDAALPIDVGIQAREVGDVADLHLVARDLGVRAECREARGEPDTCRHQRTSQLLECHGLVSCVVRAGRLAPGAKVKQSDQTPSSSCNTGILSCNCAASNRSTMRPCSIT